MKTRWYPEFVMRIDPLLQRLPRRSAVVTAALAGGLVFPLVGCSDGVTGSEETRPIRLALAVVFPQEGDASGVDAWRVAVSRSPTDLLADESGAVDANQTAISVQFAVLLESACEDLSVVVELSSGAEVWFRSEAVHEICTGSDNALPPQELAFVRARPEVGPANVSLTVQEGRIGDTSFRIVYPGEDDLAWSAVADDGGVGWLGLGSASGTVTAGAPQDVQILADATDLSAGAYDGQIVVSGEGFRTALAVVDVRLDVTPAPRIGVDPTALLFTTVVGRDPEAQAFTITNTGGGVLAWNATPDAAWLGLGQTSGTLGAGALEIVATTVEAASLPPGDYTATVTVSDPDALDSPKTISIDLIVLAAGFTVAESGGATTVDETGTVDDFTVVLDVQPSANVVFDVFAGDPGEASVNPSILTFTPSNWSVPRTVTVQGVDDLAIDGDQLSIVTVQVDGSASDPAFAALPPQTVAVTTTDDDASAAGFTVVESGGSTVVSETGSTDDFTVVLDVQPPSTVVIDVSVSDPGEATAAPSVLTFSPSTWNVARTVVVTGVDDGALDGPQASTVRLAVDDPASDPAFWNVADQIVAVTTTDDESAGGGSKIAFASAVSGDMEVYTMNPDGTGIVNISQSPGSQDWMPTWSPDRTQIAFASDRTGDFEIWRMDADGSNPVNLTNSPVADDQSPKWSVGGILFETFRDGNWEIYTMTSSGGSQTNFTQAPASNERKATWSPDGARIAFDSDIAGAPNNDIYVRNADRTNLQQLTFDAAFDSEPAWSPDGTRIGFRSNRSGNFEIMVMDPDGSNQATLAAHPAQEANPTWSGDSQKIVFTSERAGATQLIWIMNADGTNPVQLTFGSFITTFPAWYN